MQETTTRGKVRTGGLCHVAIDASDVGRSVQFYTDMFAMEIVSRSDRIVHLKTAGGHDSFFIFQADGPVDLPRGGLTHFHFGFRIDGPNFEKALAYIKMNGVKVRPNPHRAPGRYVYIEDPDGYVIQLEPAESPDECGG